VSTKVSRQGGLSHHHLHDAFVSRSGGVERRGTVQRARRSEGCRVTYLLTLTLCSRWSSRRSLGSETTSSSTFSSTRSLCAKESPRTAESSTWVESSPAGMASDYHAYPERSSLPLWRTARRRTRVRDVLHWHQVENVFLVMVGLKDHHTGSSRSFTFGTGTVLWWACIFLNTPPMRDGSFETPQTFKDLILLFGKLPYPVSRVPVPAFQQLEPQRIPRLMNNLDRPRFRFVHQRPKLFGRDVIRGPHLRRNGVGIVVPNGVFVLLELLLRLLHNGVFVLRFSRCGMLLIMFVDLDTVSARM
jgi:hypothetical protein